MNGVLPSTTLKNQTTQTVATLISTQVVSLYQNLIVLKSFLKVSLSQLLLTGLNFVIKLWQMGFTTKTALLVAPNGSISYINDVSASIHPITQRIEERQEKKIGKIYYPAAGLSTETIPYYTSAYDMDMRKVIDVYAAATEHVDQGLSLTLFMRSDIPTGLYEWKKENKQTTRDLSILRNYAFNKGIKSIYYVRTYTDDGGEVGANQCESCVI